MDKTILIAEDEAPIAKLVQFKLEKKGYKIIHKNNGKDALEAIKSEKPDLILLDVMMPYLTGFEVLKEIKSNLETKDIPVIMLTAMGKEADAVKGFDFGVIDYIRKPFNYAELVSRINRVFK
jgi:two-component system, OmpR family, alkaline phosphatase synthesis response regulator PhoP